MLIQHPGVCEFPSVSTSCEGVFGALSGNSGHCPCDTAPAVVPSHGAIIPVAVAGPG